MMEGDREDQTHGHISYHNSQINIALATSNTMSECNFVFNHELTGASPTVNDQAQSTRGTNKDGAVPTAQTYQTPKSGEFNTKKSNTKESKPVGFALSSIQNTPKVVIPGLTLLQNSERRSHSEGPWGGQAASRPAMIQNDAQTWEDLPETEASQNTLKRVKVFTVPRPRSD
ncbi:hypothetical protein N7481_007203 [Penicillium waksmanii]|uniref:uncharacterized protein n=1 Tax=Penicillium waksmanii TaxID=69791 RepID=UPI002548E52B|nr:uncharacterized protein N7481_007203 [Penicillium waksmanii]KAJ5979905.1 hypothetical protein N7481_007203 [Penicillium waksmanii]